MSLLKVLIDIQDINGIRQKIRNKYTKFLEGEPLTPWDLIANVRDTIAKDNNYWQTEEIIATDFSQSPNTSFLANANKTRNTAVPLQNNQQWRRFDGPTPSWLIKHTIPEHLKCAVQDHNGDWSIQHHGITFWYCSKCKRSDGQYGIWNKHHSSSQHRLQIARNARPHYPNTKPKRGRGSSNSGRSNRSFQSNYQGSTDNSTRVNSQNCNTGACPPTAPTSSSSDNFDPALFKQFQAFMEMKKNSK